MPVRDIVVIGASAGGFEATQVIVAGLPADFRGAVFVTVHLFPRSDGILPQLLRRSGPLPAVSAEDGMPIEMGSIYVAPPDYHLVLQNGFMQLSHGPRENMQRPCINVMFRSAAAAYEDRVAGVLLTGLLDDGAAGLWEIQQHHGTTIVQDPEEATYRSMPDSAIRGLNVQYIVRLREIPPLLQHLAMRGENEIAMPHHTDPMLVPSGQVCPECGGVMQKANLGELMEFRCHTGHRFGLKTLIAQKSVLVERALIGALAQSEELTKLLRTEMARSGPPEIAELQREIDRRSREQEQLRHMLENSKEISQFV